MTDRPLIEQVREALACLVSIAAGAAADHDLAIARGRAALAAIDAGGEGMETTDSMREHMYGCALETIAQNGGGITIGSSWFARLLRDFDRLLLRQQPINRTPAEGREGTAAVAKAVP